MLMGELVHRDRWRLSRRETATVVVQRRESGAPWPGGGGVRAGGGRLSTRPSRSLRKSFSSGYLQVARQHLLLAANASSPRASVKLRGVGARSSSRAFKVELRQDSHFWTSRDGPSTSSHPRDVGRIPLDANGSRSLTLFFCAPARLVSSRSSSTPTTPPRRAKTSSSSANEATTRVGPSPEPPQGGAGEPANVGAPTHPLYLAFAGTVFHRIINDFMIQGGSCWATERGSFGG